MNRINLTYHVPHPEEFQQRLLQWSDQYKQVSYLNSNNHQDPYASFDVILAVDAYSQICCNNQNSSWQSCKEYYNQTNDWIFGYFSYDLKNDIEDLTSQNKDSLQFPDLYFFCPRKLVFIKNNQVQFCYHEEVADEISTDFVSIQNTFILPLIHEERYTPIYLTPEISKADYISQVEKVLAHIQRGDIYELNFCTNFSADTHINPLQVFHRLNNLSISPFSAFMKADYIHVICASPERFLKKTATKVISQPIKGTAGRHKNTEKDLHNRHYLGNHPKERSENIMTVDLVRNDLSKIAKKGSVQVEELCATYTFSQVHQLISTISCESIDSLHPVDMIKSMFPAASMTGVPKIKSMQLIEKIEQSKRGVYSGALGYISPTGDFDFNVIIRSILYNNKLGKLSLNAGGAITSRSIPEKEYEEFLLKTDALKQSLKEL